ncbi:MAG: hypothetical protein ISS93_01995 [Candidatus Aenigmarchaeota archaeon]|nr:hypothetical protein [Candidatus Aenigmarchaeota archaeon]
MKTLALLAAFLVLLPLVSAQPMEDAASAIENASQCIQELKSNNLPTGMAEDLLIRVNDIKRRAESVESLKKGLSGPVAAALNQSLTGLPAEEKTYAGAISAAEEVCQLADDEIILFDSITAFSKKLDSYSTEEFKEPGLMNLFSKQEQKQLVDTSEAASLLEQAREAFYKERYEEASSLLEQAKQTLEESEASVTSLSIITSAGKSFIETYWVETIIVIAACSLAALVSWRALRRRKLIKKIHRLKREKKSLIHLMKKAQEDRFKHGIISESLYKIKTEKYQSRLARIKETLPALEAEVSSKKQKNQEKK